jgi:hypothetical protein
MLPHLPRFPTTLTSGICPPRIDTTHELAPTTHIDAEYLSPSYIPYPPCDITRILSKHQDKESGLTQYKVELALEHLTAWDIQPQLDDGFRLLLSSTPTYVCLPIPSISHC